MQYFSSKHKLGILGGGQLGKMLLYNTRKFDIHTSVLDPNKDAPSRLSCDSFFHGDLMDYNTVYDFGKKVDSGAHLSSLKRTRIGEYMLCNAFEINDLLN